MFAPVRGGGGGGPGRGIVEQVRRQDQVELGLERQVSPGAQAALAAAGDEAKLYVELIQRHAAGD
jgi:hypothetical protein